ncbi:MAG: tRNA preQ1(34) S-adenosylmethionine ribosyltransferase-isomerase QueA [Acidobacteria bacterium]|nr:tRNA preQ1(34) S-adenosylmethionine ribosyltransferase-isomerase QueA [Acidobacteriota bacterium]
MLVSDFDFELPDELIAQQAPPRGASRLLLLDRDTGAVRHDLFSNLPTHLRAGDLLVVNDTRVVSARLLGHRVPSGGAVECLLIARMEHPPAPHSTSQHPAAPCGPLQHAAAPSEIWSALMHPGQKLKPGAVVRFEGPEGVLIAEVLERKFHGRRSIRLWAEGGMDVASTVDALGHVPLPPYIKRPDTSEDRERYQTVFARARGSVAAPTAGLHFTRALLDGLAQRGIERAEITLHVGYGTFKPVRVEQVDDHRVDPEAYEIGAAAAAAINRARDEGRRVIAVGTTTTRALEAAAMRGGGRIVAGPGFASLFIRPSHPFEVISGLITNFHLPKSSLLMLVAAFAGRERVLDAYREAVRQRYRFYSYGDAMVIL